MTDWRQIQARIRKARGSSDAAGQLAALYEHTHDAMVAFELARVYEKTGLMAEAIRWYASAAERFRRAQWKQKAEEALTRLGAPITAQPGGTDNTSSAPMSNLDSIITEVSEEQEVSQITALSNIPRTEVIFDESAANAQESEQESTTVAETPAGPKRKRRGRRGGRGRNKSRRTGTTSTGTAAASAEIVTAAPVARERVAEPRSVAMAEATPPEKHLATAAERKIQEQEISALDSGALTSVFQSRARSGDPGLSSRLAKLESQLRRLLACSLHSVEEPEIAPAGPGVFLITDSDQTSYYYIEACQTLRVGIGNLLRSGRGSRESANVKEKLADHLGINESRVSKYMKDNCGVRWLQLDEGAPLLAHFAIAVLHPIAND